jgi:hypothetical protein
MAKIDLTSFGGLMPKLAARSLPGDAAQVAIDLEQNTHEFRPVANDTTVVANSGVTNPATIFRFQRKADGTLNTDFTSAATWAVSSVRKSYAKGQVNNDLTDRHYVSFDDGSAAPRAVDVLGVDGSDRQLGVPAPDSAPVLVLNVVDEFTTEERSAAITNLLAFLKTTTESMLTPVWRGSSSLDPEDYRPGWITPGYADRDYIPGVDIEESQQRPADRHLHHGHHRGV